MGNLTKEQKLEILSNAIDAGYYIEIKSYENTFEEGIKFLNDNALSVEGTEIKHSRDSEHSWLVHDLDKFEFILFFDKVEGV